MYFRKKKNNSAQIGKPLLGFKSTAEAMKKHIIMYMLLDPENCFYQCKGLKEKDVVEFFYKDKKLYTMGNRNVYAAYIFSWLMMEVRKSQDDFARFFEILDRACIGSYAESMVMDAYTLCDEIKYYFHDFQLGNSPEQVKTLLAWTYIDIRALHKFFLETEDFLRGNLLEHKCDSNKRVADCTGISDLQQALLAWQKP